MVCCQQRYLQPLLSLYVTLSINNVVVAHSEDDGRSLVDNHAEKLRRVDRATSWSNDVDGFYDITQMTHDEKLDMAKMAYTLTKHSDNVDWELQRDNYFMRLMEDGVSSDNSKKVVDGNDDAYDGGVDDTLDIGVTKDSETYLRTHRRLLTKEMDAAVFDAYEYSKGDCDSGGRVPCAPDNLQSLCDKYDRVNGSFRACLDECKKAFCCIHDAPKDLNIPPGLERLEVVSNCNEDPNCAQYNYCYIAWWKLHDTVGPALFLRVEQDDDFYDIDAEEIQTDSTGEAFYEQLLLHHFDDLGEVIRDGTVTNPDGSSGFDAERIFVEQGPDKYWNYPITDKVEKTPGEGGY